MESVACIDIGTNSVLLLVARRQGDQVVAVSERATITRLGENVDTTRQLARAACERTLACLRDYAQVIREHGVTRVIAVGTSAMRDAAGGDEFRSEAAGILGSAPLVVSGEEEAELTFAGALSGLDVTGPVTVFDVGGGSTEVIVGEREPCQRRIRHKASIDVGSVRLFERFLHDDPPTPAQCQRLERHVQQQLSSLSFTAGPGPLLGVAGTVTTLAAIDRALEPYASEHVHGARLARARVDELTAELAGMRTRERMKLPGLSPKRADVIVAGGLLVRALMEWARANTLVVSDRGVRWGLAERALLGGAND